MKRKTYLSKTNTQRKYEASHPDLDMPPFDFEDMAAKFLNGIVLFLTIAWAFGLFAIVVVQVMRWAGVWP